MTEEPYRWLEAVENRREYVREQLRSGTPVLAASLRDGILLVGVGPGRSKIFEVHDREAMAALGHPADIEKVRQAAVDAAHIEAFTRAAEDITLRRLVSFNLGPLLKQQFEQLFSAPYLGEFLFAELGRTPGQDVLVNLHFDGAFTFHTGGIGVAASDVEAGDGAREWLAQNMPGDASRDQAARWLLHAWHALVSQRSLSGGTPTEAELDSWREAVDGRQLELGWLGRQGRGAARFEALKPDGLGL
ncbi:MAG: 20S proteasome subunit A/B [Verrucomicrobiae bacterium]|jgi:proteasome alpha subunit|nr:20S proteasome subunit A/B [Verrucomicrobiae bacterium]